MPARALALLCALIALALLPASASAAPKRVAFKFSATTYSVVENAGTNYGAYVPDLPGCVATGATKKDVERLIREAIELHLEGMAEDGLPIPEPTSDVEYVEVDA